MATDTTPRAFNDATCTNCHRSFGWRGTLGDKPACPACGHKETPNPEEDERVNRLIAEQTRRALEEGA